MLIALLLAALLAQQAAESPRPSPAQEASRVAESLSIALLAWGMDHPPEGQYLERNNLPRVDFERAKRISVSERTKMLVPAHFDTKVPGPDPWGHEYELLRNADPEQHWSWAVRSAGPDGKFCSESYLVPQPDWDKCDDIVRVDGELVAGPEKLEGQ